MRSEWHPEYAEYMLESIPGLPYGSLVQHFNIVEHNMNFRRRKVQSLLQPDEVVLSLTNFPRFVGTGEGRKIRQDILVCDSFPICFLDSL